MRKILANPIETREYLRADGTVLHIEKSRIKRFVVVLLPKAGRGFIPVPVGRPRTFEKAKERAERFLETVKKRSRSN